MIQIRVDEEIIKEMYEQAVQDAIDEIEKDLIFWDSKELRRRTCLSWNTIQDTFFHDERFPKAKIGGKWLFPAKETEKFLVEWLKKRGDQQ